MKTTFDLPDELVRKIKLRAVVQGRTVKDLVAEFLREGLGMAQGPAAEESPASSMVEIGERGLPVIRCRAQSPATRMSVEELLKLERETQVEEDLKHARIAL